MVAHLCDARGPWPTHVVARTDSHTDSQSPRQSPRDSDTDTQSIMMMALKAVVVAMVMMVCNTDRQAGRHTITMVMVLPVTGRQ